MNTTNTILATLVATGIASSAAYVAVENAEKQTETKPTSVQLTEAPIRASATVRKPTVTVVKPVVRPASVATTVEVQAPREEPVVTPPVSSSPESKPVEPAPPVKTTRTNRAKIHTRNALLGVVAANELLSEGGGKEDRRKVLLGVGLVNELFRRDRERIPEVKAKTEGK